MKNSFVDMTFEELVAKREELQRKLHDIRAKIIMGQVNNTVEKRNLRRQIARLNTRIYAVVATEVENSHE